MLRVVVDPGVLVSGLLVADGPPGRVVDQWRRGSYELVVSPALLDELADVLARPHLSSRVPAREAQLFVAGLRRAAVVVEDPPAEPGLTADPGDDYLVALARAAMVDAIVSGDRHLTDLEDAVPPILTPRAFAELLARGG